MSNEATEEGLPSFIISDGDNKSSKGHHCEVPLELGLKEGEIVLAP